MRDSSDIDNALVAKLGSDAALLALMPNGAYIDEAPPGATRFVIVSLVEAPDEPEFGRRAYEEPLYLVKAVALSSSGGDVKAAAARIDALLEDEPLTAPGFACGGLCREDRIRMTEVDAVDASIRWVHRGGHYRLMATEKGPTLVNLYGGAGAATASSGVSFTLWYDRTLQILGSPTAPITVQVQSSNHALIPDLILPLDRVNSTLDWSDDSDYWQYGRGQLIFSNETLNFTGCTGVTLTLSEASPRIGWELIRDLDGVPIEHSLGNFTKVGTVGS
jgi:hypothetical protein